MPLHLHVSARALALAAGLTLAVGAGTAGAATTSPDHAAGSRVIGHLYVNDNTAGENTIAAYARHADGTVTPVPGSPFETGGAGTGAGIGSQGALQKADDGHLLLAVDAGSDQISVMRIERGGALAPVAGGPVASGGNEPVSIAVHSGRVYVANAGTDSDYAGFTLSAAGTLTPIAGAVVPLPAGSDPDEMVGEVHRWCVQRCVEVRARVWRFAAGCLQSPGDGADESSDAPSSRVGPSGVAGQSAGVHAVLVVAELGRARRRRCPVRSSVPRSGRRTSAWRPRTATGGAEEHTVQPHRERAMAALAGVSVIAVSEPFAVKWPRYQTNPWWKP